MPRIKPNAALAVIRDVSPRQTVAAMMLAEGRLAREVAEHLRVSPETVSRWRSRPEFQLLLHQLLRDSVDATRLGLVSLCSESITHLRGLVRAFDDRTALKAISLLFSRAGPVLAAISAEVQRPPSVDSE